MKVKTKITAGGLCVWCNHNRTIFAVGSTGQRHDKKRVSRARSTETVRAEKSI